VNTRTLCEIARDRDGGIKMDGNLSNYALNKYVSSNLSELTENNIQKLQKELSSYRWVNSFILTSIFQRQYDEKDRIYILNMLRKVESLFINYHQGGLALDIFLTNKKKISSYFEAIMYIEITITHTYHAFMFGKQLAKIEKLYDNKNESDNSPLKRLNLIHRFIKHYDEKIGARNIEEISNLPIWLSNQGIHTIETQISFVELSEMINELEQIANVILKSA
jgi:hypothetical protein